MAESQVTKNSWPHVFHCSKDYWFIWHSLLGSFFTLLNPWFPSSIQVPVQSRKCVRKRWPSLYICSSVITLEFVILLQVLTETDHCYCVLLNAHGGAAFPSEKEQHDCNSSNTSSLSTGSDSEKAKNTKVKIISFFHFWDSWAFYCGRLAFVSSSFISADLCEHLRRLFKRSSIDHSMWRFGMFGNLWLQLTLFSGFVSYQMVREAYDGMYQL